jgi:hypothetical protein
MTSLFQRVRLATGSAVVVRTVSLLALSMLATRPVQAQTTDAPVASSADASVAPDETLPPLATPDAAPVVPPPEPIVENVPAQPAIAALGPRERAYVEPIPYGYRPVTRTNKLMVGIGIGTFALAYKSTVSAIVESVIRFGFDHAKGQLPLLVPVVGPWLTADPRTLDYVLGGFQAAGVVIGTLGFLFPRTILLRVDYQARIHPTIGPRTLGLQGSF